MEKYDEEFLEYVKDIINSEEFIKRKEYLHHPNKSVYQHSLEVAYASYKFAKKHHLNVKDISVGALLHDFYYKPWQENTQKKKFTKMHGFVHAREALENARTTFPQLMYKRVEDIIVKHMFPLNIKPPKYKESWVVSLMDKKNSLEVFKHPKEYPKFIGLGRKKVIKSKKESGNAL